MTISLSNLNEQPSTEIKQIKIRTLDCLQENKPNNAQKESDTVGVELEQAQKDLDTIVKEKDSLLQETKKKIEQEKQQWEKEREQWIEEAKTLGYNAGFKEGKEEGRLTYQQLLDEANTITDTALKDYHATVEKSTETILDLSIHTAEKIMNRQLTDEPNKFNDIVMAAISEIKDQPIISIYLHPTNYKAVVQQKGELVQLLENEAKLSIYTRENIAEHSCLIEHPFGQIDASIDTQLGQIRSALQTVVTEKRQ